MISLLLKPKGPRILFVHLFAFRSGISLHPVINNKEITAKGLENHFVRSGISIEVISLEAESTVFPIGVGFEAQYRLIGLARGVIRIYLLSGWDLRRIWAG